MVFAYDRIRLTQKNRRLSYDFVFDVEQPERSGTISSHKDQRLQSPAQKIKQVIYSCAYKKLGFENFNFFSYIKNCVFYKANLMMLRSLCNP